MKFYSFALALAATATGACAQSTVDVYGRLDVSIDQFRFASTASRPAQNFTDEASDVSMFGFRGREDLGGGMLAYFKLEAGLQLNTGTSTSATQFWNRESYVGLGQSGVGSIQLGSMYSPTIYASVRVDPFSRFTAASMIYLLQGLGGSRGFPSILNNSVAYVSPTFAGVSGKLLVSAGQGSATGGSTSASIEYDRGPVYATLTYDRLNLAAAGVGLTGAPAKTQLLNLGATYDFGVVKLHGWYESDQVDRLPNASGYMVGLSAPIGQFVARASYTSRSVPGADASIVGLGGDYVLSKRTLIYTALAKVDNSGKAAYASGPALADVKAAGLPAAGRGYTSVQLGIRHSF